MKRISEIIEWRGWKGVLEFIVAAAVVGYAIITCCQWRDIRRNFTVDQRAWLGVGEVAVDTNIREGMPLKFYPILMNSGKTPALHVMQRGGWSLVPLTDSPTTEAALELEINRHPDFLQGVIQPGAKRNLWDCGEKPLTKQQEEGLRNGSMILRVFAKITYRDIFGEEHLTKFCSTFDPHTMQFGPCPFYQDAN